MLNTSSWLLIVAILFVILSACAKGDEQKNTTPSAEANKSAAEVKPAATPSKDFTPADVAKLKWIEGTWRGMDGDKPFFERYKIEENAMIAEGLKEDGSASGDPTRFELKNGEFGEGEGDTRSAATEITDSYIQFVPAVPGKGNSFRFERQSDGTWIALLEWNTADKSPQKKLYKMEPWPLKK